MMDIIKKLKAIRQRRERFIDLIVIGLLTVAFLILSINGYIVFSRQQDELNRTHLTWQVASVRGALESMLESLSIQLVMIEANFDKSDVFDNRKLDAVYRSIMTADQNILGIGIINSEGKIVNASGKSPAGSNEFQAWVNQTRSYGHAISNIVNGNEYFVMAINKEFKQGADTAGKQESFVVYMVVNIKEITQLFDRIHLQGYREGRLTNSSGVGQFAHGRLNETVLPTPAAMQPGLTIVMEDEKRQILYGFSLVNNAPWVLSISMNPGDMPGASIISGGSKVMLIISLILFTAACGLFIYFFLKIEMRGERSMLDIESFSRHFSIGRISEGIFTEINNPLEIINQNAGLMKDILSIPGLWAGGDSTRKGKFVSLADGILEGVLRSRSIMQRFIQLSSDIDNLDKRIDITGLIEEVKGLFREEMVFRSIDFEISKSTDIPDIVITYGSLHQVLLNVFSFIISELMSDSKIAIHISSSSLPRSSIKIEFVYKRAIGSHALKVGVPDNRRGSATAHLDDIRVLIARHLLNKNNGDITIQGDFDRGVTLTIELPIKLAELPD